MRNISIDTRTLNPGDIFIPIKGPNFDGNAYIKEAIEKGASEILKGPIDKLARAHRKKLNCPILAITGSFGKTTAKDHLYHGLSQKFKNILRTHENENNEIGVPLTLLKADFDTDLIIIEMAIRHTGEMAHLTQIVRPTHVLITGIGLTHVEEIGSPKKIAVAKSEIFRSALAWEKKSRHAFINDKSNFVKFVVEKAQKKGYKVQTFDGEVGPDQTLNMTYTIAHHFGLTDPEIEAGLKAYKPSAHRLNKIQKNGITIIDDTYNSNPTAVRYALKTLKQQKGRKLAVIGDMLELGKYAEKAHKDLLPDIIDAEVEVLYTIGELTKAIRHPELVSGSPSEDTYQLRSPEILHFKTKKALSAAIKAELKPGDTILLKASRSVGLDELIKELQ